MPLHPEMPEHVIKFQGKKACISGVLVDLFDPQPDQINLLDIGWGISGQIRFGGQCLFPYSVAQHAVLLSTIVPPHLAPVALMHDAAEAYVGDVILPLKMFMPFFDEIEEKILQIIFKKFGLDYTLLQELSEYDLMVCPHEARTLQPYEIWTEGIELREELLRMPILPWTPEETRRAFFLRADQILGVDTAMSDYVKFCQAVGVQP